MTAPTPLPGAEPAGGEPEAPAPPPRSAGERLLATVREPGLPVLAGFAVVVAILVVMMRAAPLPPDALRSLPADPGRVEAALPEVPGPVLEAVALYGAEDLEGAASLLAASRADGPAEALRRAYLGSALARLNRPREALDALGPDPGAGLPEPWAGEARWTRAIALRDAERPDEARRTLQQLSEAEGPIADRARRLLGSSAD